MIVLIIQQQMISYDNPICSLTENRATLFCCTENCTEPAFACTMDCLFQQGHIDHKAFLWSKIDQFVRKAKEVPLEKDELLRIQKQEKQLKIVIESLKIILSDHQSLIILIKKQLQLKQAAEKVLSAVQNKTTNSLTGGDMANLIKTFQSDDLFKNKRSVAYVTQQRNQVFQQLITKLNALIEEHKTRQTSLRRPEQIPNDDSIALFTVDTNKSNVVVVKDGIVSIRPGTNGFYPIYARQELVAGESFEIEVIDATEKEFAIGVASADLINRASEQNNNSSLCIYAKYSLMYYNGVQKQYNFRLETGNRVTVRRTQQNIQWMRDGELLCAAPIPKRLNNKPIYPVVWIFNDGSYSARKISKLRFL